MNSLSEEQKRRIETNRIKAQELRKKRIEKTPCSVDALNNVPVADIYKQPLNVTSAAFASNVITANHLKAQDIRRRKVQENTAASLVSNTNLTAIGSSLNGNIDNNFVNVNQPSSCLTTAPAAVHDHILVIEPKHVYNDEVLHTAHDSEEWYENSKYGYTSTSNSVYYCDNQQTFRKANYEKYCNVNIVLPTKASSSCEGSDRMVILQKIEENRKKALALRALKNSSNVQNETAQKTENTSSLNSKCLFESSDQKHVIQPPTTSPYNGPVHVAKCCLQTTSSFYIVTKFHSQFIAVIKQMSSRKYDAGTCRWSLTVDEHDTFLDCTKFLEPQVKVQPLPKFIISCLKQHGRAIKKISSCNPLCEKLLPFQREGVEFVLSLNGRALIADDMGLGKTIQAICVMQEYHTEWPVLVICPSSLRLTWSEAFTSWLDDMSYSDVNVLLKGSDIIGKEKVTIISYDLLTKFNLNNKFKCAIADESHFIKNGKTVRCKAAVSLLQSVKRCVLLTGTPALSRPIELYTQLQCVNKKLMPSYQEFGIRYCSGTKTNFGWDFTGNSNLEELNIFMSANFMIRRLKKDVLDQLPGKRRKKIIIETRMSKKLNTAANVANNASKANYQACFFDYYSETSEAKLPAVLHYITELVETEKKFLVFAHHRTMLCGLRERLLDEGIQFIMIDGTTAPERRQDLCDKFQSDPSCLVALLSITAANTGFTLTAADTVVFAELFYNPGILQQAEDRVHRIGQRNSVVIHYLVAHKTSDDTMWPMIESKLSVLGGMGVGSGDFKDTEHSNYNASDKESEDAKQCNILSFFAPVDPHEPTNKKARHC